MAVVELFFEGVAVIKGDDEAAIEAGGDAIHKLLRVERNLHAFSGFGMDGVAVEEFQFLRRRRCPGLHEAAVASVDAQSTFGTENLAGQGIEEFVGEDDRGRAWRWRVHRKVLLSPLWGLIIAKAA